MLRRAIGLLVILTLGILWLPLPTGAQPVGQVPRIGILSPGIGPAISLFHEALRQGLRELGYVEGQSIAFEYRSAEGRYDQLPALAAELVALNVDVIVTWSTPAALAAKHATSKTPVVFTAVADPVLSGLITSFAQPDGNLTGVTHIPSELDTKRLELLKGSPSQRLSRRRPLAPGVSTQCRRLARAEDGGPGVAAGAAPRGISGTA